jgi:hypothetical protein
MLMSILLQLLVATQLLPPIPSSPTHIEAWPAVYGRQAF